MLNDIENAIYEFTVASLEANLDKPDIVIKFSPEGYNRCRSEKMASCFFNHPTHCGDDDNTFAGYPYEVVSGQVETFKVELSDER